jgi:hypothetical protein
MFQGSREHRQAPRDRRQVEWGQDVYVYLVQLNLETYTLLCRSHTSLHKLYVISWGYYTPLHLYIPTDTLVLHICRISRHLLSCPFVLEIAVSSSMMPYLPIYTKGLFSNRSLNRQNIDSKHCYQPPTETVLYSQWPWARAKTYSGVIILDPDRVLPDQINQALLATPLMLIIEETMKQ